MSVLGEIQGKTVGVKLWAPVNEVESAALDQLRNIASLPWVFHHVAAMADVHLGKGATVGSVIAMKGAVAPSAVGVDIGCGMGAIKTSMTAGQLKEKKLVRLFDRVNSIIPTGFNGHESVHPRVKKDPLFTKEFDSLHEKVQDIKGKAALQCGTLGGGNHFIELCTDNDDGVWMMLHSGSRNIGKEIAEAHIKIAKTLEHNKYIGDRELSVFLAGTPEMQAYRNDLYWAQRYAFLNRVVMFDLYKQAMWEVFGEGVKFEDPILCHHNYVAEEVHFGEDVFVTRKGAIRAGPGDMGIIPGSMGTKSYIVRGLGNEDSFSSASHGAGRKMSRSEAKRRFTKQDLEDQTKGIVCRKDNGVIDEIPKAYKNIEKVMANQSDLVEVVAELKQVMNVKG